MTESKITFDLGKLEKLRRQLGSKYVAQVGIFGDNGSRNQGGITNPELGLIHELGSETRGIPARSWLRMPIESKRKEIVKFLGTRKVASLIETANVKGVFALLGVFAESVIQRAFESRGFGQWPALKPQTIDRKGSSSPLIDTAQFRRAVTSRVGKNT